VGEKRLEKTSDAESSRKNLEKRPSLSETSHELKKWQGNPVAVRLKKNNKEAKKKGGEKRGRAEKAHMSLCRGQMRQMQEGGLSEEGMVGTRKKVRKARSWGSERDDRESGEIILKRD